MAVHGPRRGTLLAIALVCSFCAAAVIADEVTGECERRGTQSGTQLTQRFSETWTRTQYLYTEEGVCPGDTVWGMSTSMCSGTRLNACLPEWSGLLEFTVCCVLVHQAVESHPLQDATPLGCVLRNVSLATSGSYGCTSGVYSVTTSLYNSEVRRYLVG